MLGGQEQEEIRQFVYSELAWVEKQISRQAGTYNYLCLVAGHPTFCHRPVGAVLRSIFHPKS